MIMKLRIKNFNKKGLVLWYDVENKVEKLRHNKDIIVKEYISVVMTL